MNLPIVVGVDGSEAALEAVRWAARDAALHRVPLRLVSAVSLGPTAGLEAGSPPEEAYARSEERQWRWLSAAAQEAFRFPGSVEIAQDVLHGHPGRVLIEESKRARRVVVGAQGTGAGTSNVVGSTAEALLAHGECPVVVARRPEGAEASELSVIVGIDGSRVGEAAVEAAFEEASVRQVSLVAVHTWIDVAGGDWFEAGAGLDWSALVNRERAVLAERLAGWQEKYPDVEVRRVVERDRPVRYLVKHGAQAQLVVVGSRGRGGFTGMLLGSTSRALVHSAPCPLMIVRPFDR